MLNVNDINVYYGSIHATKGVSFTVNEGEIVTLIGANGAGKSTILKTISGILRSKTGQVSFMGEDITKTAPHTIVKKRLAQVPEGRRVFAQMTVRENLEMGHYTRPGQKLAERIDEIFAQFPRLSERSKQLAGTLSGGEQQMLAMGRAMMSRPKLLMLDEPSMGLAPLLVQQIFEIITGLNELGVTILLVEQNAHMALNIANRGYVLETGRIVLEDDAQALRANDDVRKAYLGG